MKKKRREIKDYDENDTAAWIDRSKRLDLEDLGFKLPPAPPTQVISIRLPTPLLNQLRAQASAQDIPYQALIKLLLARSIKKPLAA
jgi:predicted DNA binding CopG/RHH family protein